MESSNIYDNLSSSNIISSIHQKKEVFVTPKNGIMKERIVNVDEIKVIEELIKCSICLELLNKPFECRSCGSLFCEDCIQNWLKTKNICPLKCKEFNIAKAGINTKKLLNLVKLKCNNFPDCNFIANYWDIFEHEPKCEYQKLYCPNEGCKYFGKFSDLKLHLLNECPLSNLECGFCKAKIHRCDFSNHIDQHNIEKSFFILECCICGSSDNLRRCLCKKGICINCLNDGIKREHHQKNCYVFNNGLNYTTETYNISKMPLPLNFEAKIYFKAVEWVRTGITFDRKIADDKTDVNCPAYDIYCILEDLVQFYTLNSKWKYSFKKEGRSLQQGDYITMRFKNGELRYLLNGIDLGTVIKLNMTGKKDMYLLVHCRNQKTRAEIVYITEIFSE